MWIFWTRGISMVAVLLFLYSCMGAGWQGLAGQLYAWCLLQVVFIVVINISEPMPTALDVYRDNTKLKIISVNGIPPTDTVVAFKNTNLNIY